MGLEEFVEHGKSSTPLLHELAASIFATSSPVHDGAVVIRRNRIAARESSSPFRQNRRDARDGTRHRAAFGVSSETDAVAVVVSEETGTSRSSRTGREPVETVQQRGTSSGFCSQGEALVEAADLFRILRRIASRNLGLKSSPRAGSGGVVVRHGREQCWSASRPAGDPQRAKG